MKKATYFYLLRRGFFSGGGLDSDYQAVLDQATTRGFTAPSDTQQNLQSNIIKTLKAYGVWDKLDLFYLLAGEQENFARLNWKAPASFELANSGTPTFTSNNLAVSPSAGRASKLISARPSAISNSFSSNVKISPQRSLAKSFRPIDIGK